MFRKKEKSQPKIRDRDHFTEESAPAPSGQSGRSIIGPEMTVKGDIDCPSTVLILGSVIGNIHAREVVVGPRGTVHGEVTAETIIVAGHVKGLLFGRHVQLSSGAHVEADLTIETIEIDHGAQLQGSVFQASGDAIQQPATKKLRIAPRPKRQEAPLSKSVPRQLDIDSAVEAALDDIAPAYARAR